MHRAINRSWLVETSIKIRRGEITMKEAAKNAEYKCVDGITEITSITERHLRRLFKENFIKVFYNIITVVW